MVTDEILIEKLSFEEAIESLQTVVDRLEGGQLSLEETLSLFERGRLLAQHCHGLLDLAQQRVSPLGAEGADLIAEDETDFLEADDA